jgi:hypothetical protein
MSATLLDPWTVERERVGKLTPLIRLISLVHDEQAFIPLPVLADFGEDLLDGCTLVYFNESHAPLDTAAVIREYDDVWRARQADERIAYYRRIGGWK